MSLARRALLRNREALFSRSSLRAARTAWACEGTASFSSGFKDRALDASSLDLHTTRSEVEQRCKALHRDTLLPLNEMLLGPLEKDNNELTPLPFVFCLGNHSSGKSTFINYVLDGNVQDTGVAPTDDGFTVIAPGEEDVDRDGHALIGDPDMGFGGLRGFGPGLMAHCKLKLRADIAPRGYMLVDSPGMIDSPVSNLSGPYSGGASHFSSGTAGGLVNLESTFANDRGYNFPKVVRWFAERADVILLFFDPDKVSP